MPTIITRTEYLEVNSVPLSTPAWWITNLTPEMLRGPTLKGADIDIPHAAGGLAVPRRVAVGLKHFAMVITGNYAKEGTFNSNWRTGLVANVEYLTANLGIAQTGAGTVTATWHRWDGSTKAASVVVTLFEVADLSKRNVSAVLEVSVPAGVFA